MILYAFFLTILLSGLPFLFVKGEVCQMDSFGNEHAAALHLTFHFVPFMTCENTVSTLSHLRTGASIH
jgi:hypothetical protein